MLSAGPLRITQIYYEIGWAEQMGIILHRSARRDGYLSRLVAEGWLELGSAPNDPNAGYRAGASEESKSAKSAQ